MDYKRIFARLDEKLAQNNLTLQLYCVGGFVLEYYGLKATDDIDAFYESSDTVEKLIQEVGDEFHIGTQKEPWLNNAINHVMSKPFKQGKQIFEGKNLTVSIAPLQDILMDKISVGREKDIPDIAKLMVKLSIKKPDVLLKSLEFSPGESDPSIILEAYSMAYGESALRAYLMENPNIMRLLR